MQDFVYRAATISVDGDSDGLLEAVNDRAVADVKDLTNVEVVLNQITDGGTATLTIEKTHDGTNWVAVGTKADSDFVAGANKSVVVSLSDSNGMPLHAKQVRVTVTAATAGGAYTVGVAGLQRSGYSS